MVQFYSASGCQQAAGVAVLATTLHVHDAGDVAREGGWGWLGTVHKATGEGFSREYGLTWVHIRP